MKIRIDSAKQNLWKHRLLPYLFFTCFFFYVRWWTQRIEFSNPCRKSTPWSTPLETTRARPPSHWFYFPQPECELQPLWNTKNKNVLYNIILFVSFLYYHVPLVLFASSIKCWKFLVYLSIGSTLSKIGLSLLQKCFRHSSWNPRISSVL